MSDGPSAEFHDHEAAHPHLSRNIKIIYAQYALMAVAAVPPMVFLVDFVARGLGAGTHVGSIFWIIYGMGAIIGPPLYGLLADSMGPRAAVRAVILVQAITLTAVYLTSDRIALAALTILIGSFAPGMVPLALARVRECIPQNTRRQDVAWGRATIVAAAAMAIAGYAFSGLLNASGGNHRLLFLTAAGLLVIALLADLGIRQAPSLQHVPPRQGA
jgi:predicted MFS family arabinose efflux permease